MDSSNRAPMIMFNTYMTQFTCPHHDILICEKSPLVWMRKENPKGLVSCVKNESKPRLLNSHAEKFIDKVKRRVPKLLLECPMQQLHNNLIASPYDGVLLGSRHAKTNDVIISDTLSCTSLTTSNDR